MARDHPYYECCGIFKVRNDVNTARTSQEHRTDDAYGSVDLYQGHIPSLSVYVKDEADIDEIEKQASEMDHDFVRVEPRHAASDQLVFVSERHAEFVDTKR